MSVLLRLSLSRYKGNIYAYVWLGKGQKGNKATRYRRKSKRHFSSSSGFKTHKVLALILPIQIQDNLHT